jgi:transposase
LASMKTLYSVLKNLFPFKGYKPTVLQNSSEILVLLKSRRKCGLCPSCNKRCRNVETEYSRTVRDLDLGEHKCFLKFFEKKIRCRCGYRGIEKLDFISKSRRVTKRMETYIVSLAEKTSLKDVADIAHLDWKTVKDVDREYIKSLLPDILKINLRRIAMDEIAIMKGHKYCTIIRDYDTGVVIKICISRTYDEVKKALLDLGKEKLEQIRFVSLDMWDPYIKALTELCPHAKLVFDKFHVVKKINEALDSLRKSEFSEADPKERKMMKHRRFIILKRRENLEHEERDKLRTIMKMNKRLYKSYLLKEQILSIFNDTVSTFEQIEKRLNTWFENVYNNCMNEFYGVVSMMKNHLYGILNYFRYGMTNAIAEGFNTKINIIKRRAYGFKDLEYFLLKIYQSSLRRFA